MNQTIYFITKEEAELLESKALHTKCIHIDFDKSKNKKQLLQKLQNDLCFPEYFGNNFDALYDCLLDLEWIEEENIFIFIHAINKVKAKPENHFAITLIHVLYDAKVEWLPGLLKEFPRKTMQLFLINGNKNNLNLGLVDYDYEDYNK